MSVRVAWTMVAGLATIFVAFGGCVEEKAAVGTGSTGQTRPTVVDSRNGTASIDGLVTDDEAVPIKGAEIQLVFRNEPNAQPVSVSSDAEGKFSLTGLGPGNYVLYARRIGYYDAVPKTFELADGEAKKLTLELRPLPGIVPVQKTDLYKLTFLNTACVVAAGTVQCGARGYSGVGHVKTYTIKEDELGELKSVLVESKWENQIGALPIYYRNDVFSPEQTGVMAPFPPSSGSAPMQPSNPYHWASVPQSYKSPTRLLVQRESGDDAVLGAHRTELNKGEKLETSGNWIVTIDYYPQGAAPTGVYVVANHVIDAAVTLFFVAAIGDPAFTAL